MLLALISFPLNRGNIKHFTENLRFVKHETQKSVYENGKKKNYQKQGQENYSTLQQQPLEAC